MGGPSLEGGHRIADSVLEFLNACAADGTPCVLATVVRCEAPTSARPGDKAVVTADGRLRGWVGGSCSEPVVRREALLALERGEPLLIHIVGGAEAVRQARGDGELTMATTCPSGGSLDVFLEPQLPQPLLVVFGATPAARTLLRMGALSGFRTCAVHPGARAEEFPGADLVLPELDLARAAPGADSWAVVATMGHYDEDALEAALAHPRLDVALIASRRRTAAVREVLASRGLDPATLDRIRAPSGRVRGASQEEIALLALADVVTTRRRRAPLKILGAHPKFANDPVCGMTVELPARHQALHLGQTYSFCCDGCRQSFEAEPERYLRPRQASATAASPST
jgi:xanthine dehydrogenase accessory factor